MRAPLEGIRVADFTWVGAGPYTTKMLSDNGATVIKIESGVRPDVLRLTPPFAGGKRGLNRSGYFANRNTNKESITLNMNHPAAHTLALRLLTRCDIVANSFSPGTMERWGLGYEQVRAIRPDSIYLSMPMHGGEGPHSHYLGFGSTIAALCGLNYLSGLPGREPVGTGTNYPDHVPNPGHAAFAILAALRHRERTGQGQYIEVSQVESTLNVLGIPILVYAATGRVLGASGNRAADAAPYGAFPCRGEDRWCAIAVRTDAEWQALRRALGDPEWARDPSLATVAGRLARVEWVEQELSAWTRERTAREVMAALQSAGAPAGVVQDAADLLDQDPHLRERGHWVYLDHPEMGRTIYSGSPFRMTGWPSAPRRAAPLLGEQTRDICRELLELTDAEIETHIADGAIA